MSDATHAEYEALPLEAARRVDRVCDRFERAWQAGQRPRAEDFLGPSPRGGAGFFHAPFCPPRPRQVP
jgi:hypothetical protein